MRTEGWPYTIPLRLRSLFGRRQVEQDLDDELQYHLEKKTEEYIEQGLKPSEARYAALRAMGGMEQRKEECRDARRVSLLHNLTQDLRYGVRMMRKTPGFSALAALTLAVGIGATTAIFSLVNAVLLEPLPYPNADQLVQLMHSSPSWAPGRKTIGSSVAEFNVWRKVPAFSDVAAYSPRALPMNLTGREHPEQLRAVKVSEEYFRVFAVPVKSGRGFSRDDDRPGGRPVVVISDGVWRTHFGSDPSLVGQSVVLGGEPYTVIGIVEASFSSYPPTDIWLPLQADPSSTHAGHLVGVAARLKPDVTLDVARAQMRASRSHFENRFSVKEETFTAEPLWDAVVGDVKYALTLLFGAVIFLLLIVCANVANLLLARATGRQREIAVRAALGAARSRLVSQLLAEGLLLAAAGAALGVPLGHAGVRALTAINNWNIPRIGPQGAEVALDARLLAFALLTCILTTVFFGILPALHTSRTKAGIALSDGGFRTGPGGRQKKTRSVLVIAEIALAAVLLTGAALLIRTLSALRAVSPGFNANNVVTMNMALNDSRFRTTASIAQLIREAERRVESLPGISALAATYSLPVENSLGSPFVIDGGPDDRYVSNVSYVSRNYFEAFRIPVLRGRTFTERDSGEAPPVIIVNDTLLRGSSGRHRWRSALIWRHEDPLEERIILAKNMGPPLEDRMRQVVGVVGEVRDAGLGREPQPLLYVPIAQINEGMTLALKEFAPLVWAIRTRTEPTRLIGEIQRELRAASGGLPVAHVRTMNQVLTESLARDRFLMILLSSFAGVALLLAATGVYGLMAYTVRLRTREIGIRLTLGARPKDVRKMVLFESARLTVVGVSLGVVGGLALAPLLRSQLFGVQPSDASTLIFVAALLSVVALLATWIPARSATRVDPSLALRWE